MNCFNKKILCIIPARSGGKSKVDKNIKLLNGKPLIYYTINAAINCSLIDDVFVSSNSKKYLKIAENFKSKTILRPDEIATDRSSTEEAVAHFLKIHQCDITVLLQPTSPMVNSEILKSALSEFIEKNMDSMTSVYKDHGFWWQNNEPMYDPSNRPMRQQQSSLYKESGMFYIFKSQGFLKNNCRIFGKKGIHVTPKIRSFIEIDEMEDFKITSELMKVIEDE